jgi:NAD(P)-dependent dehydrogenase (short-subunit alcohol dehydrogenase family)
MEKKVLITGATGNLGTSVVDQFKNDGYRVAVTVTPGKKSSAGFSDVLVLEADLTNERQSAEVVQEVIQEFKSIDAALLLVGGFAAGKIEDSDGALLKKMFALNFETAYNIARPVFLQMKKQQRGRIVLVGARPALQAKDGKNFMAYALSKSLLFKLAEFLNEDGSASDVVTSVLVPSTIDTPTNRAAMPKANFADWVSPDEIANALAFLCSDHGHALRQPVLKMYGKS